MHALLAALDSFPVVVEVVEFVFEEGFWFVDAEDACLVGFMVVILPIMLSESLGVFVFDFWF